ncbi:RNA polymerase subunit sigma-70 [Actinomadura xylanilytica]|uniref:RNA polymerase subunit sigma-70 n=1 Tax=Actinomadura xylanilytica TaxID=887459 RepID=UPI00255ADE50|nr:RNA polymerase subunit sigma-70 [Actinomadura xylanilytica]MDL4776456.1 RNA polymerase subunit sigma-70 [Actinomadura xylanilytica]
MVNSTIDRDHDFQRLADPYRRELLAHCHRMLGSIHDAEDLVQETYLRAWRSYGGFEGRSSLRTWLYRIATNACLTAIHQRGHRPLPSGLGAPDEEPERRAVASPGGPWPEPAPGAVPASESADPASIVAARESTRLAFAAALQLLPPNQRVVLILRDVLKWRAAEVAGLMRTSTVSVNSALQRARARLERAAPARDELTEPTDPRRRELLDRYAAAFEAADIGALIELFKKDAVWEMPPFPEWYAGAAHVGRIARTRRGDDGVHRPFRFQVVRATTDGIARISAFSGTAPFAPSGRPERAREPGPAFH